jgi:hypothetical protein
MGSFTEDELLRLAHALPNAAKQIEDIHFSGCVTEGNVTLNGRFRAAFPNVRTLWGYSGLAPKAPVSHLQAWDRATRGRKDEIPRGSIPAHENAVTWSSKHNAIVGKAPTLPARREACRQADGRFDAYKSGELTDPDAAHIDYSAYQSLAQAAGAQGPEREEAAKKGAVMLRIRKYEHVREHFAKEYGPRIRAACAKAGISAPDFATLSRKQALEAIAQVKERITAFDPELCAKLEGFAALDRDVVKEEWCA